jgi:hypothetical protein
MKKLGMATALLGVLAAPRLAAESTPALNANDWNFVLVQSLEAESGHGNNLSISRSPGAGASSLGRDSGSGRTDSSTQFGA